MFMTIRVGLVLDPFQTRNLPDPNTPMADSSDIMIKPYNFPTFTWFYSTSARPHAVLRD